MLDSAQLEHLAGLVQTGSMDEIKELALGWADNNPLDKLLGRSLLHHVALIGEVELYEGLAACRLRVDQPDCQGETPEMLIRRWKPAGQEACLVHLYGDEKIPLARFPFIIGRDPEKAHYRLTEAGTSSLHLKIEQENGAFYICDLGSLNGTFLNNTKLIPNNKYLLLDNDIVRVNVKQYAFKYTDKLSSGAFLKKMNAALEPAEGKISLNSFPFTYGREEFKVSYAVPNPHISRVHMEIDRRMGVYVIRDLGSSNGTYLNGERLTAHKDYPLRNKDAIRIENYEYEFGYL